MNCPHCKSSAYTRNGHSPNNKQRWKCKNCNRTFSVDTLFGYPPTSVPFEFIALILYHYENYGKKRFILFVTNLLEMINLKPVHRTTFYSWIRKYDGNYKKLISFKDANDWFWEQNIQLPRILFPRKKRSKKKGRKSDDKLLIEKIEKLKGFHTDFLDWLKDLGIKGKLLSDLFDKHPKDIDKIKKGYIELLIKENISRISLESYQEF